MIDIALEHFDKVLPLTALAAIAAVLLYLLRLSTRERTPVAVGATQPAPLHSVQSEVIEDSVIKELQQNPIPIVENVSGPPPAQFVKPKKERALPPVVKSSTPPTIARVLVMLADKDALTSAILLREILDRPVSRRR